jgi:hypothetical protein
MRSATRAMPISHGMGRAKPIQNTASIGRSTRATTAPVLEPRHTSQAAYETTSINAKNTISITTKRSRERLDHGPPYIGKRPANHGR